MADQDPSRSFETTSSGNSVDSLRAARLLFDHRCYDLARQEVLRYLVTAPESADAHNLLAFCSLRQGDLNEAMKSVREAKRLAPDNANHHYAEGLVLVELGELPRAEASMKEALRLSPQSPDILAMLANLAICYRNWSRALELADQGLAADPNHHLCQNYRATGLMHARRGHEAQEVQRKALSHDPGSSFTHANQGWLYLNMGDHEAALRHFRASLRIDPCNEWAEEGLVDTMKHCFPIYEYVRALHFWLSRREPAKAQSMLLLLLMAPWAMLYLVAPSVPSDRQYLLYLPTFALFVTVIVADSVATFVLQFHPLGRRLLGFPLRSGATVVAFTYVMCVCAALVGLGRPTQTTAIRIAVGCGAISVLAAGVFVLRASRNEVQFTRACFLAFFALKLIVLCGALFQLFWFSGEYDVQPEDMFAKGAFVIAFATFASLPIRVLASSRLRRTRRPIAS